MNNIQVGEYTNIQDGVTVHVARHNPQGNVSPTIIGSNVTIGARQRDRAAAAHSAHTGIDSITKPVSGVVGKATKLVPRSRHSAGLLLNGNMNAL